MTIEQIATIIVNALVGGGVIALIHGLRKHIVGLNKMVEAQNKTIETLERRLSSAESAGNT